MDISPSLQSLSLSEEQEQQVLALRRVRAQSAHLQTTANTSSAADREPTKTKVKRRGGQRDERREEEEEYGQGKEETVVLLTLGDPLRHAVITHTPSRRGGARSRGTTQVSILDTKAAHHRRGSDDGAGRGKLPASSSSGLIRRFTLKAGAAVAASDDGDFGTSSADQRSACGTLIPQSVLLRAARARSVLLHRSSGRDAGGDRPMTSADGSAGLSAAHSGGPQVEHFCGCPLLVLGSGCGIRLFQTCGGACAARGDSVLADKLSAVQVALPRKYGTVTSVSYLPQTGVCGLMAPVAVGTSLGKVILIDVSATFAPTADADRGALSDGRYSVAPKRFGTPQDGRLSVPCVGTQSFVFMQAPAVELGNIDRLCASQITEDPVTALACLAGLGDALAVGTGSGSVVVIFPERDIGQRFENDVLADDIPAPASSEFAILVVNESSEQQGRVGTVDFVQLPDDLATGFFVVTRSHEVLHRQTSVEIFDVQFRGEEMPPGSRFVIDTISSVDLREERSLGADQQIATTSTLHSVSPVPSPGSAPWTCSCVAVVWSTPEHPAAWFCDVMDLNRMTTYTLAGDNDFGAAAATVDPLSVEEFPMGLRASRLGLGPLIDRLSAAGGKLDLPRFELSVTGLRAGRLDVQRFAVEPPALACIEAFAASGYKWFLEDHDDPEELNLERAFEQACVSGLVPQLERQGDAEVEYLDMLLRLVTLALQHDALTPALCALIASRDASPGEVALRAIFSWVWTHGVQPVSGYLRMLYAQLSLVGESEEADSTMGANYTFLAPIAASDSASSDEIPSQMSMVDLTAALQSCVSRLAACHSVLLCFEARSLGGTGASHRLAAIQQTAATLQVVIWFCQRNLLGLRGDADAFSRNDQEQVVANRRARKENGALLIDVLVDAAGSLGGEVVVEPLPDGSLALAKFPLSGPQLVYLVASSRKGPELDEQRRVAAFSVIEYALLDLSIDDLNVVADFADTFNISARDLALVDGCHALDSQNVAGSSQPFYLDATSFFQFAFDSASMAGSVTSRGEPCLLATSVFAPHRAAGALVALGQFQCAERLLLCHSVTADPIASELIIQTCLGNERILEACQGVRSFWMDVVQSCETCRPELCDCGPVRALSNAKEMSALLFTYCVLDHPRWASTLISFPLGVSMRAELESWLREDEGKHYAKDSLLWELLLQQHRIGEAANVHQRLARASEDSKAAYARRLSQLLGAGLEEDEVQGGDEDTSMGGPANLRETAHGDALSSPFTTSPAFQKLRRVREMQTPSASTAVTLVSQETPAVVLPRRSGLFPSGAADATPAAAAPRSALRHAGTGTAKRHRVAFVESASFGEVTQPVFDAERETGGSQLESISQLGSSTAASPFHMRLRQRRR